MPTRNISLTREQDEFVARIVEAGEYQNASEAVRDALRALQQRRKQDELKLELLRAQLAEGFSALERGDATEIDELDLDSFFAKLGTPRTRPVRVRPARGRPARRKRGR